MTDFDRLHPEVSPVILDLAYGDAEDMIASYIDLWRAMGKRGTPKAFLDAEGKTDDYDEGFLRGGLVGMEALLSEFSSHRDTIFLES